MNIRSLTNSVPIIAPAKPGEASERIKSQDTAERDADGRQPFGEKKRKVTDEELEKIIANLKAHPGVVANNLVIELDASSPIKVLLIKSPDGQIVRRVSEENFYQLLSSDDQLSGRLINRTA